MAEPIAEQAELAVRLAREDPGRAELLATEVRAAAVAGGDAKLEAVALRALGLVARARRQIPEALAHLDAALSAAQRAGDAEQAVDARLSLAATLVMAGDKERAMATLDAARARGPAAAVVAAQRATVLSMLGRYPEALAAYRPVVPAFRRSGDRVREARALNNRGLLHVYVGRFARADGDLREAERLMADAGNLTEAALYHHNRGFCAARRGDLPLALELFEEAERRCRQYGVPSGVRLLDRASALLAAGLVSESRLVAEEGLQLLRKGGDDAGLAEGLLLLADVELLAGDARAARAAAEEAAERFAAQGRPGWRALAEAATARAALEHGTEDATLGAAAADAAAALESIGLADHAVMAHAVAGRLLLAAGTRRRGIEELGRAAAARRRGGAAARLAALEALAHARLAQGDRRGATASLRAALAIVQEQQAGLAATELRAHVAVHARAAAELGLSLALESGRAACLWQWMERHRANGLRAWPVRAPHDEKLAGELAELRTVAHDAAVVAANGDDPSRLLERQIMLERAVREHAWRLPPHSLPAGDLGARPGVATLSSPRALRPEDFWAALGDGALVELAEIGGELHAVVLAGGRCAHRRLASASAAHRAVAHLRLSLRRLAYARASDSFAAGAVASLRRAAAELDELRMAPLIRLIGDRPLVLVPTGNLHAVPWAALPTTSGRSIVVAPSARLWLASASLGGSRPSPGRVLVVAGPGLPGAEREARAIASLYRSAQLLIGEAAGAAAVMQGMGRAAVAHLAAHARFRADNALWSSLELADGGLTVYELERMRRPPQLVVLSACQSGLSAVRPGDEVMGLVAALLTLGARTVIASVVPVDDSAGEEVMVALHRRLLAGAGPAEALAAAQSEVGDASAASFVCFGGS